MPYQMSLEDVIRDQQREHEELQRVSDNISDAVLDFCSRYRGLQFHMGDLEQFVARWMEARKPGAPAPGSASRILRQLKADGRIEYQNISRRHSLYTVTRINAQ